jgi:copper(I)-binding protein
MRAGLPRNARLAGLIAMRPPRTTAPAALAAAVVLAGCGGGPQPRTIDTMGNNGRVGEVLLRNVYLEAPRGGSYGPGDTATLRLHIISDGDRDDRLLDVRSAAEEARIRWDRDCDGEFETVDGLPVESEGPVPYSTAYYVELAGLDRTVRAGTTLPVTFEFEHAGTGTVEAMVEARLDGSRGESLSCGTSPGSAPSSPTESDAVTVSGAMVAGVEPGCLLLDTGTTRYLLTGSESPLLESGGRLTVSGTVHPDMPTTCMEGIPFRVIDVQHVQPVG